MKRIGLVTLSLLATACGTRGLKDAAATDQRAPLLEVTSPARGMIAGSATTVEVKGTASDAESGLASVSINGTAVSVAQDGTFSAVVPVTPGVMLLHTVAKDRGGNEKADSRSLMAGQLADPAAKVQNGLVARINSETLHALGDIGAEEVNGTDLGAVAQGFNPIANKGFTCLNVQVYVDTIDKSMVVMDLTPVVGGIAWDATIYDLDVEMSSQFKALCIGGSAGISLTASSYHLSGVLDMGLSGGQVSAAVASAQGGFNDFQLSVGIIPSSVLNLIPDLDQKVANVITSQMEAKVPEMVQRYLGGYGYSKTITLMGNDLELLVAPTTIDFNATGGTVVMDTTFKITGNNGGAGYPIIPAPMPSMPQTDAPGDGFRLAVNDNAMNQLLNAFWATGIFDRSIDLAGNSGSGLAGLVDSVELYLPYPPIVSTAIGSSAVTVTVGDLTVVAKKDGLAVTKVAISAQIGLQPYVDSTGAVRLTVNTPTAYFDVIDDGTVTGPNPLSDATVEALGGFVVAHATTMLDNAVGAIPVPQFQSAQITNLSASPSSTGGFVELGGNVEAP